MLLCGTRVWPARDLISQDEYQVGLEVSKTAFKTVKCQVTTA
jgi:hypothetical protein